jgi:fused signal recognition particle receptor
MPLGRFWNSLVKTREGLLRKIQAAFPIRRAVDADLLQDLERILIEADVGVAVAQRLVESVARRARQEGQVGASEIRELLGGEVAAILRKSSQGAATAGNDARPHVILVVGVNGTGKTTLVGKLASRFRAAGEKVLVAACDTYRPAAQEQLAIWARRAGVDIVESRYGSDPAAVAYDAVEAALSRGVDTLIVDTAGRLQTKHNLMEELKKIHRVLSRRLPSAPNEVLLALDATTGQNALSQARLFNEAIPVTGLAVCKLDGTAKGGIVLAISEEVGIPVKWVGVGEKQDDLDSFDPDEYAEALVG